ncbi:transposase family protein [Streptomyces sp. NPDC001514]
MCRQSATVCLTKSPALGSVKGLPLVERLRVLPDPRRRRGVRHPFVAVLLVAASAVLAGARSCAAIGQRSGNAPQHALARLGARVVGALGVRVAPSAATIRRVVGLVCPGGLADLTGADPAGSVGPGAGPRGDRRGSRLAVAGSVVGGPCRQQRSQEVDGCSNATEDRGDLSERPPFPCRGDRAEAVSSAVITRVRSRFVQ